MLRRNKPTVSELKSLYESEMYQNLLKEYARRSNRELDNDEENESELLQELTWIRKSYALLDTPFEEILSEFRRSKDLFLEYQIANLKKYNELPVVSKIHKTYLLACFCEFYMSLTALRQNTARQWNVIRERCLTRQ